MLFYVLFCKRLVQSVLAPLFSFADCNSGHKRIVISHVIIYLQKFQHADWLRPRTPLVSLNFYV